MPNFIYVFDEASRDVLLASNYVLLKQDTQNNTYIFANDERQTFANANIQFALSNTLTF